MQLNEIAAKQYEWVERMGWHNKTVLEAMALIASEIGEAAAESFTLSPTFGEELSDIVLRTADLGHWQNIDIDSVVEKANTVPTSGIVSESILELIVDLGKWINTARGHWLGEDFGLMMGQVLHRVMSLASLTGINLEAEVARKMSINDSRGTRGRRI